jgi:hypothetical protein
VENQHVVHVQGLAVALGGAAQQRTRVIVVSQDMVEFHGIRAVRSSNSRATSQFPLPGKSQAP